MGKISRIFSVTWSENLAYRTDILIWTLTEGMVPLVALALWFTVSQQGVLALSPQETLTYYVAIFFVRSITNTWVSFYLTQEILNGTLVQFLTRPISIFWKHIAENLTVKVIRLLFPTVILVTTLVAVPNLFSSQIFEPYNLTLFFLSLLGAMILAFTFDAIFAMIAFWIEDAFQVIQFQFIFREIATGVLIPFAVMPHWLFNLLAYLPFRYTVSAPVEILLGQVTGSEIAHVFAIQAIWFCVSFLLAKILWKKGLKRYAIPGQ